MTKEEFEQGYIERGKITEEFYNEYFVTLPCNCGDNDCNGFAAIRNNEDAINTHLEFYT